MSAQGLTYRNPPICEVSYSLQFEPLDRFHLGHLGMVWGEFMGNYPDVERAEMLSHEIERFGTLFRNLDGLPRFQMLDGPPLPRILMTSADGVSLLQVQKDRFIHNWRRISDSDVYPRFKDLKDKFEAELDRFESFVNRFNIGSLAYNQVEITNVNQIPTNGKKVNQVFKGLSCGVDMSNNLDIEGLSFRLKHIIENNGKPVGRLYTTIEKANRLIDDAEVFMLTFVARANPSANSKDAAMCTLEILRDTINNSFQKMVSEELQQEWGKE